MGIDRRRSKMDIGLMKMIVNKRSARVIIWNAFILVLLMVIVFFSWETIFPDKVVNYSEQRPLRIVPGVGLTIVPGAEVRYSNGVDFSTVTRANSLGFLDREPISTSRSAESCHVTILGDSIIEAREVPIPDKMQVQLEDLAARELSHLDITTSAFAMSGTGQINQIAYYDEYARRMSPNLVVLMYVYNDWLDNSRTLTTIFKGWGPDKMPFVYAMKTDDGTYKYLLPDPNPEYEFLLRIRDQSYLNSIPLWKGSGVIQRSVERVDLLLTLDPSYKIALGGWHPRQDATSDKAHELFDDNPPPVFVEARDLMVFAMDEFSMRAARDGFNLLILANHTFMDSRKLTLMTSIAEGKGIPIINMGEYMALHGANLKIHWPNDFHLTPYGHEWAAKILLDFLKNNQEICDD